LTPLDQSQQVNIDHAAINGLKRGYYDCLGKLARVSNISLFSTASHDLVDHLFATVPALGKTEDLERYARQFVNSHRKDIDGLITSLGADLDLRAVTGKIDALLASANFRQLPASALPISAWSATREVNEIKVDRISPRDAETLPKFRGPQGLKGVALGHFAAFLSRDDYLLGRLHALDRLVDIVLSSANIDTNSHRAAVLSIKQKGFRQILNAEEKDLPNSGALIAAIRRAADELNTNSDTGSS
jgi:hypothetical protein